MKDIAKPLKWENNEDKSNDVSNKQVAPMGILGLEYRLCLMDDEWLWYVYSKSEAKGFSPFNSNATEQEAKQSCQKHYEELVLSMLSPEAVGLLLKHDF